MEFNKKAIAVRGWLHLTRNLLDHPNITASKEPSTLKPQVDSQSIIPSRNSQLSVARTLNYQSGFANTVLLDILQDIEQEAIWEQIQLDQEEG